MNNPIFFRIGPFWPNPTGWALEPHALLENEIRRMFGVLDEHITAVRQEVADRARWEDDGGAIPPERDSYSPPLLAQLEAIVYYRRLLEKHAPLI